MVLMVGETSPQYKKGAEGELYITEKIAELGFKVLFVGGCQRYSIDGTRFYCVDLLPFGKGETFWVQVKYKEPRKFYPDTGLEKWRYDKLLIHQKESGKPVLLLFTDNSKKIYGEWASNLKNCISYLGNNFNTKNQTEMIYFLLEKLKDYKDLLSVFELLEN